jgi:hypothetical protein
VQQITHYGCIFSDCSPLIVTLQRDLQNMLFYYKGLRVRKTPLPLSLAPGKPRFYVGKFGQDTKVTL